MNNGATLPVFFIILNLFFKPLVPFFKASLYRLQEVFRIESVVQQCRIIIISEL